MSEISEELESMTNSLTANVTEIPGTETPSTEVPSTELPSTDAPSTDTVVTDAPSTSAPTTDAPDEMAELRAELELLRSENKGLKSPKTDAPGTSAPSTSAPISSEDFLGDIDLDDLTRDPKKFNDILNNVFKKGIEVARGEMKAGSEGIINTLPGVVKSNIAIINSLKEASDNFYKDNEDLKQFKNVVGVVFEETVAANPDKSYIENLNSVGLEVRKRLNLTKPTPTPIDKKPPKLPSSKGSQRPNPNINKNSLASEIDTMNKTLEI